MLGRRIRYATQEGCLSLDNASEAFAVFLLNCNNAMEVLLSLPIVIAVRDDEIVLDSGSEVHPLTPEATFYICSRRSFGDFVLHLLFDEDADCVVREQQQVLRYWGYRVGSQ